MEERNEDFLSIDWLSGGLYLYMYMKNGGFGNEGFVKREERKRNSF